MRARLVRTHRLIPLGALAALIGASASTRGAHAEGAEEPVAAASASPSTSLVATAPPAASAAPPAASASSAIDPKDDGVTPRAIIGPVLTPVGGSEKEAIKRIPASDPLSLRAREVETALKEALQDLGLALDVAAQVPSDGIDELSLVQRAAQGEWVISPRLEQRGSDKFVLRIVAAPPHGSTLLVRIETVDGAHLAARAVVMLRDLVAMKLAPAPTGLTDDSPRAAADHESARSRGLPVLAVSSSLFGLYGAMSIHRSAGNDDPRLLYPLLLLGSGIGLGASLLTADEWNVTPGAAWTISAGSWWGVVAGLNLAAGHDVKPVNDRYAWGLGAGLAGTGLAIVANTFARFDDGDAALVHSGAVLGTFTGGLVEAIVRGDLGSESPSRGFGWGSAAGLVAGGVLASAFRTTPSRVFLIDLGSGIGALGGAAVTSALVFSDKSDAKTRGFLSGVLAGTVVGGVVAYFITREPSEPAPVKPAKTATVTRVLPTAGVMGVSQGTGGAVAPIFGAGVAGAF